MSFVVFTIAMTPTGPVSLKLSYTNSSHCSSVGVGLGPTCRKSSYLITCTPSSYRYSLIIIIENHMHMHRSVAIVSITETRMYYATLTLLPRIGIVLMTVYNRTIFKYIDRISSVISAVAAPPFFRSGNLYSSSLASGISPISASGIIIFFFPR